MLPIPVRVVGCGSPCGDDSVGWRVVAALRAAVGAIPRPVELHVIATPDRLLDLLDGRGSLILVDGMVSGAAPGTVLRCTWPDARLNPAASPSSHGLSVVTIVYLAARLHRLPAVVVVFGVECEPSQPGSACSSAVAAAVPTVARAIITAVAPR